MDLTTFGKALGRHILLIAALTALGVYLGSLAAASAKPTYTATTSVVVSAAASEDIYAPTQSAQFINNRIGTYAAMATQSSVLRPVYAVLGEPVTYDEFARNVTSSFTPGAAVITITVTSGNRDEAATAATLVADGLVSAVTTLELPDIGQRSRVFLTRTGEAEVPLEPSVTPETLFLVGGGIAGLALGVAIAMARAKTLRRVRNREQLRRAGVTLPLAGALIDGGRLRGPVADIAASSKYAASVKALRTTVVAMAPSGGRFVVAAGTRREGASTTASRLAVALAEVGRSTVLVDADLRRPSVDRLFPNLTGPGLGDVAAGRAELSAVVQVVPDCSSLSVVLAGQTTGNHTDAVSSAAAADALDALARDFEYVIVDGPALLAQPDALAVAHEPAALLLVVGAHKARAKKLRLAQQVIAEAQVANASVLLNRTRPTIITVIAHLIGGAVDGVRTLVGRFTGSGSVGAADRTATETTARIASPEEIDAEIEIERFARPKIDADAKV